MQALRPAPGGFYTGTKVPAYPMQALRPAPGSLCGAGSPCAHLFGRSAPSPGLLSRVEKVGKDTPGTSWFLDLRRRGPRPPLIPRPSALAVLVVGKKVCGILEGNPPTAPRIENTECSLDETKGKNKTDLPTNPKWQIGLFLWLKPYWGVRQRRRGDNVPPSGGPGAQPRHAFGSFRRETKGTPGVGRVGPLVGAGATNPA